MLAPFSSFTLAAALLATSVLAAEPSPVGIWKTIDEVSHEVTGLVEISEHEGILSGRVVKLFRKPEEDANPRCGDCPGERHDQPVLGMTILWNIHRDGEQWDGGQILDPDDGRIYRCKLHPVDGGARLEVRGFIGISLLGRTQVWERLQD